MRIIAGAFKGRVLQAPSWEGLRPTSDRLRETLFNILAPRIAGAVVADVCAGTGAVGLEALSRGAAHVTFVEQDRRAVALIEANVGRCGVSGGYTVDRRDALATGREGRAFDIVFVDPPYAQRDLAPWVASAAPVLAPGGLVVLEHASRLEPPAAVAGLVLGRRLRQGDSALAFYAAPGGGPE
ncbi:methyltransferase small [Luteitalea sp. TBR-22]|uniref:16S rRNA (guanine(966)-N(2))-methyltransferase RsmD n=1 Tax=Luteitalea sp. TBR-22 TaxID=2802971 RepID=UPI001AF8A599|nr:16S rRNA (guanine(966)-N(2))-methyltransferase RsmD [Luteitalea sp. TBR-22]BCS33581.1 methyltransferase small [Luteitalea sp. TBR-22]